MKNLKPFITWAAVCAAWGVAGCKEEFNPTSKTKNNQASCKTIYANPFENPEQIGVVCDIWVVSEYSGSSKAYVMIDTNADGIADYAGSRSIVTPAQMAELYNAKKIRQTKTLEEWRRVLSGFEAVPQPEKVCIKPRFWTPKDSSVQTK